MLTLRPYQEEAVVSIFEYFVHDSGNPIVAAPTGSGKALIIAEFIRRALYCFPGTRIMCATHVKELVDQNHKELLEQWPTAPAGIYSAGLKRRDNHLPVTFCGIGSVAKRTEEFGLIHILLVDECHLISDKDETQYAKAIDALKRVNPLLKVVGFTATPYRLGVGRLTEGRIFTDLCFDYTTLEKFNLLIEQGYLAPLIPKRTQLELAVEGVSIMHGEFNAAELQAAVDKDSITRGALWEAGHLAADRWHWLVFCTGTKHADHACAILNEMGITAVAVYSDKQGAKLELSPLVTLQPGETVRDAHIRAFKSGRVRAMVGVGIFTTGFNYRPVDCIVVLRPTMSTVLWVQLLGRGTRPSPETEKLNCLVLDFAANTRRLGPINDPVIPRRKGKKGKGEAPFKVCTICSTYNHARARLCVCCGGEFPEVFAAEIQAATDELIRTTPKEAPAPEQPPEVVEFIVQRVEYAKHFSKDAAKPPSLRVTYYCGMRTFNEWLCFEHQGFAKRKARDAWRLMAGGYDSAPETVDDALDLVDELQPPSVIRVLMAGKFPEVVGYEFGRPGVPLPTGQAYRDSDAGEDDDIPF